MVRLRRRIGSLTVAILSLAKEYWNIPIGKMVSQQRIGYQSQPFIRTKSFQSKSLR